MPITFRQTNASNLTSAHDVSRMVISPLRSGNLLQEMQISASISEYLFEMTKDGHVFWVGAAVPRGNTDFSRVQVFFHPTVIQNGVVRAADADYTAFRGGWPTIQRYVAMQGSQLAAARPMPLIVPFMTMAAGAGHASYMFSSAPVDTLTAIVTAVRDAVAPGTAGQVQVSRIGVSSFSSGIGAMRLFISTFGSSGLIAETTDFDGPFIIAEPKVITRAPGAAGRVFSQVSPPRPLQGWVTLPASSFRNITAFRDKGPHAQIGWMMFYTAAMGSVV